MYAFLCDDFKRKYECLLLVKAKPLKECWLCKSKVKLIKDINGYFFCYDFKLHIRKDFAKFLLFKEMQNTFTKEVTDDVRVI